MRYRVGIDIGGTFTDFVVVDQAGKVSQWKEDSTPADPLAAIDKGLRALAEQRGLALDEFVGAIDGFVHGSTIATNALITRQGGPVGLICTAGFRDVLYFRDGFKWDRWNIHLEHPRDLVDRYLRIGVTERIGFDGEVMTPLDEGDVSDAADRFRAAGVRAVAIALLWSVANPVHERRVAQLLAEQLPDVYVLKSSDVLPETREWQRTSATVLSAYVLPRIGDYLARFEAMLEQNGLPHPANYMQINGGTASVEEIMRRPVMLVHSGPAAAPAAAAHAVADSDGIDSGPTDSDHVITVDMGGTSFDVCLIREGKAEMSRMTQVEHQPVGVQAVEVASIGAGGGSIGWVDAGGALRVGPRSAGAVPGPVCYDAGGTEPTVTDANVLLGYLSPEAFLGGRRKLRADLAEKAVVEHVADRLGLDPVRAAAGIIEVVNASMVGGIRSVSVERGIDPRGYLLVSAGGAGALHSARLARQLGMSRVLFPPQASTFCALGMIVTDVQHDYAASLHGTSTSLELSAVDATFAEMEATARKRLREDGFPDERIELRRYVDARYKAQVWEITVPIPSEAAYGEEDVKTIAESFHVAHERQFTYALRDQEIEFLHWRLTAIGQAPDWPQVEVTVDDSSQTPAPAGEREAYFPELSGVAPTPFYRVDELAVGAEVKGPAIFESDTTTMVINPDDVLHVLGQRNLLVDIARADR
jgi:N-methylhydantoinase A